MLTLVIPNQEFAENVRWALSMIFVRSSLDSGAPNVRLTQNVSDGFRVCLTWGRLEILSTSVSDGHLECHSRSVART